MPHTELVVRFGIALFIGVLIGLEREFARLKEDVKAFAGIRTFPLIALLGDVDWWLHSTAVPHAMRVRAVSPFSRHHLPDRSSPRRSVSANRFRGEADVILISA